MAEPIPLGFLKRFELIYLCSPYTNYPGGHHDAFAEAAALAGKLAATGLSVFCPIAHSHPLADFGGLNNTDAEFWLRLDRAVLRHSDALALADLPGLWTSYGVSREIGFAWGKDIPIFIVNPQTLEVRRHD